ncbi:hypothetical protein V2J66_18045 [Pseudomonas alliivorans]|nr:hypothetical protein [Pseudomonas alliivorans]MEE5162494.1 hypothetical protein [Pseudomonas alliivorans]
MERTVFVFEGEKAERNYFKSLERAFFSDEEGRLLVTFQNDLYELYTQISADEDLDVFELIKELNPIAGKDEDLKNLRRDQVGQIYLFFDLEPNDQNFSGKILLDMLRRFNNETEHGKLFISYPMIEAIRDINDIDEYLERVIHLSDCRGAVYKKLSAQRGNHIYQDAKKIDIQGWRFLIEANLRKANLLISGNNNLNIVNNQSSIAEAQLNNGALRDPLSVLSAFPIFLADYFGLDVFKK